MSPWAERFPEALEQIDHMLGYAGGWLPTYRHYADCRPKIGWLPAGGGHLSDHVRRMDERWSPEMTVGLPQRERWIGGVGNVTVLWARIDGKDQLARARRFKPLPSLAVSEGASRRWLLWALREPLDYFRAEEMNRRIAYNLRAVQRWGNPDEFDMPLPGTCLRVGRSRPVPVVVARLTVATFTPQQVAGRLKDPPPRDAWVSGWTKTA